MIMMYKIAEFIVVDFVPKISSSEAFCSASNLHCEHCAKASCVKTIAMNKTTSTIYIFLIFIIQIYGIKHQLRRSFELL